MLHPKWPINVWAIPQMMCLCHYKTRSSRWVLMCVYCTLCADMCWMLCTCVCVLVSMCIRPPPCAAPPRALGHGLFLILCETRYGALNPLFLWPIGAWGNGRIQQKMKFLSADNSLDSAVNWDLADSTVTLQVHVLIQMSSLHFEGQIWLREIFDDTNVSAFQL